MAGHVRLQSFWSESGFAGGGLASGLRGNGESIDMLSDAGFIKECILLNIISLMDRFR